MTVQEYRRASAEALLSGMRDDLARGLVPMRVFGDRDIYDLELRRIFARSWVFIGHETELPNPGDFAVRTIGEDPFIFVRDSGGTIRVLFNSCRHRGVTVCRAEMGNARHFTCPYHGWTYRNNGELEGVPARREAYRELDFSKWGLIAAPHVANYHGLIFANLDPDAVPFEQHMGSYGWYMDIQFLLTKGGMEVVGEPHRWVVDSNWKQGAENFCGDSSHTHMAHRSTMDIGLAGTAAVGAPGKRVGIHVHDCDGHAISIRIAPQNAECFFGYPPDIVDLFAPDRLSREQFDFARRSLIHDGTLFPNFSYLHFGLTDSLDRAPAGFLTIRVWQPRGPDRTEIWSWILAPKEAPAEYKRRAYRVGMSSFSPSGSFEQDDVAVWPGISRTGGSIFGEMIGLKANYQMGLGPMGDSVPTTDWPGPGRAMPSNAGECGLRTFHTTWLNQMTRGTIR